MKMMVIERFNRVQSILMEQKLNTWILGSMFVRDDKTQKNIGRRVNAKIKVNGSKDAITCSVIKIYQQKQGKLVAIVFLFQH